MNGTRVRKNGPGRHSPSGRSHNRYMTIRRQQLARQLRKGIDIPAQIGLAGFNGVELLDGLPRKLATMDACRREVGIRAAQIIMSRQSDPGAMGEMIELTPKLTYGDTLRRG